MGMESFNFQQSSNNEKEKPYGGLETGTGKKSENPRISLEYSGFNNGDTVTVIRSDGSVEKDWQFASRNMETGEVKVQKRIDGKILQKEMPADIFEKIQKA